MSNQEESIKDSADSLENLEYTDGKERDYIDLIEEKEKAFGTDVISPFRTADMGVFDRRLKTMHLDQMHRMAEKNGLPLVAGMEKQKEILRHGLRGWLSKNGAYSTASYQKAEGGALSDAFEGAEDMKELKSILKGKTLSDLQSTAARLGFNPSFDRDRLISVITSEFQRVT
jgi:hypothetical protein